MNPMTSVEKAPNAAETPEAKSREAISLPDIQALRGLLEEAGDILPLRYRPHEFDGWGYVRTREGKVFAVSRGSAQDAKSLDDHRADETDPYEMFGRLIVAGLSQLPALLDRIEGLEGVASKLASPSEDHWSAPRRGGLAAKSAEYAEGYWNCLNDVAVVARQALSPTGEKGGSARDLSLDANAATPKSAATGQVPTSKGGA